MIDYAFHIILADATAAVLGQELPALGRERELLDSLLVRLPRERHLAASTAPGDLVAFLDCGAYTLDQMTPNNGRLRPEVGMIGAAGYELIRRRDELDDLLHNEVL